MTDPPLKPARNCLVCSIPVTSAHLGMDCCRACAIFFKRSKLSVKSYACRDGRGECVLAIEDKCRGCRYNRCLAVGLVYDGPLRVNKKKEDGLEASTSGSYDTISPSTSEGREPILIRIGREYNSSLDRRQLQEEAILGACEEKLLVPHPKQKVYLVSHKTSMRAYEACVAETIVFFREAFPSVLELSNREQDVLFKSYIAKFNFIDCHYRTRKVWGAMRRYCMSSIMTCLDLERPEGWIGEEDGGSNRRTLIASFRSSMAEQLEKIVPLLDKAQMTSKEFYALLALLLCDIDGSADFSDDLIAVLDDIQKEVLEDLQHYYKEEMGLSDFSTRLGNLMTLMHGVRECNTLSQEFFRMNIAVFDLFRSEELIKELWL